MYTGWLVIAVLLCPRSVHQVFEDHVTSCDILLKLAELHMKQKLYDRAVELVLQAQVLCCTCVFVCV